MRRPWCGRVPSPCCSCEPRSEHLGSGRRHQSPGLQPDCPHPRAQRLERCPQQSVKPEPVERSADPILGARILLGVLVTGMGVPELVPSIALFDERSERIVTVATLARNAALGSPSISMVSWPQSPMLHVTRGDDAIDTAVHLRLRTPG